MERNKLNGHFAMLAANLIFGLNNPVSRSLMPDVFDPLLLTFFRISGGFLLFWGSALFVKVEKVPFRDKVSFFFAAFFALTANQIPFFLGLSKTSPIDAAIVVTTLPILSMIFAAFIIKEPITFKKAFGVILGASGALFLIFGQYSVSVGNGNLIGNVIVFSAVISFALYLTLFKKLISGYSPFTIMRWLFLFGTIQSYPFAHGAIVNFNLNVLTVSVLLKVLYVVFLATFVSYLLLAAGQKVLLPTTLSMYNYLQPIVASLATVAMGMDNFRMEHVVSAVLVFFGVYFVTQSKTREQVEKELLTRQHQNES